MTVEQMNSLVLAYLGDAVYETWIRTYLIKKGYPTVKKLQEESLSFVSAKAQSRILRQLLEEDFFKEDEKDVLFRARNTKNNHRPKNCDAITYKYATALEAVLGYLKWTGQEERLEEVLKKIVEE